MKKTLLFCFLAFFGLTQASFAAAEFKGASLEQSNMGMPAVPYKVLLSQQNARVFAQSNVRLLEAHGQKVFELPIPKNATDITLTLPMVNGKSQGTIRAFSTELAAPFKPMGTQEKLRITLESRADSLSGSIAALISKNNAIYNPIVEMPAQEAVAAMEKVLPELAMIETRLASTRRELQNIKNLISQLSDKTPMSKKLVVVVDSPLADKAPLHVMYSYTLNGSSWTPMYTISANSAQNTINVQLIAKITQNSDMDWNNTQIELSTAAGNAQSPAPIRPWVISERPERQARNAEVMMMASPTAMNKATSDGIAFAENSALANWSIQKSLTIPEGETNVILHEQQASIALERVARPSSYSRNGKSAQVWLSAEFDFKNTFFPQGEADYLLDGVSVGQGVFAPTSKKTTLFFGADPLVNVEIAKNIRKSGQDGIIQKEQTYTWNWTYTVQNQRSKEVAVRIEEPQTQLGNEKMSVSYTDKPQAKKGPDNTFIWTLKVPAKGSQKLERTITVKAPKDMKVFLDR